MIVDLVERNKESTLILGDGLEHMKTQKWDHILCDPDYVSQPPVSIYKENVDPNGNIILFCDPRKRPEGPDPTEVLIWDKPRSTKWVTKRCNAFFEEILVYRGKKSTFNVLHWSSLTGIFTDSFLSKPAHPYAKPETLIERLLLIYTRPGDLVFDPFMGSGTVGVLCKKHGRRYVGCEIVKEYYDMAVERVTNT